MIKARFEGDLNQMFLFNKKTEDSDDLKGKQKISILPIVVNEIKREIKRSKGEENKEHSNKDETIIELHEDKQKIQKILVKDSSNEKHKVDFDSYIKMHDGLSISQKHSIEQNNLKKGDKKSSFSQKYSPIKIYSATRSLQNVSQNTMNNSSNFDKSSIKQKENVLIKNEENNKMKKNILSNNPYAEKLTEKHQESKRKLIKEKLKIFAINKNMSTSLENDYQILTNSTMTDKNESKITDILNGSEILMSKSQIVETMSLSESSLSDIDNLNQNACIIKKSENQRRIKRPLIKQSTVETTLSSEFY